MYKVLKPTGSFYLHCDWHANAQLRIMMDEIFGENNFMREIIWSIGTASGFKSKVNNWIRGHDTILFYKKGKNHAISIDINILFNSFQNGIQKFKNFLSNNPDKAKIVYKRAIKFFGTYGVSKVDKL